MSTTDPRDEAILTLASAIHHINMNSKSRALAERAEGIIRGTRLVEDLNAQRDKLAASGEQLKRTLEASEMFANHMPVSVSTFGSSVGAHGWTGLDAAGNRVTWKVEPAKAAGEPVKATIKQLADTMTAFAELAPSLTAAAEKRFAADPFAPTFGLLPGEDAITIELRPRPGSVQYLINVTGPHSSAVKFEGGVPKQVLVSEVVESAANVFPHSK